MLNYVIYHKWLVDFSTQILSCLRFVVKHSFDACHCCNKRDLHFNLNPVTDKFSQSQYLNISDTCILDGRLKSPTTRVSMYLIGLHTNSTSSWCFTFYHRKMKVSTKSAQRVSIKFTWSNISGIFGTGGRQSIKSA